MSTRTIAGIRAVVLGLVVTVATAADAMPVGAWRDYEPMPPPPEPTESFDEVAVRIDGRLRAADEDIVRLSVAFDHGGPGREAVRVELRERLLERQELRTRRDEVLELMLKAGADGSYPEDPAASNPPGQ